MSEEGEGEGNGRGMGWEIRGNGGEGEVLRTPEKVNKQPTNRQMHKQTNRQRIQLQRPFLSPVDRRGERANSTIQYHSIHYYNT